MFHQNKIPVDSFIWSNIIYDRTPIYLGSLNSSIAEIYCIDTKFVGNQIIGNVEITLFKVIKRKHLGYIDFYTFNVKSQKARVFPTVYTQDQERILIQDAFNEKCIVDIYASANISFNGLIVTIYGDLFLNSAYYKPQNVQGTFSNLLPKSKILLNLNLQSPYGLTTEKRDVLVSNEYKYIQSNSINNQDALTNTGQQITTSWGSDIEWNLSDSRYEFSDLNDITLESNTLVWSNRHLSNIPTNITIEIIDDAQWS